LLGLNASNQPILGNVRVDEDVQLPAHDAYIIKLGSIATQPSVSVETICAETILVLKQ